jgi:hypothetical protein
MKKAVGSIFAGKKIKNDFELVCKIYIKFMNRTKGKKFI